MIGFALAFPVGSLLTGWRPWPAVNFVMFVATRGALYGVWLPKILRRRFEAELRDDPARAGAPSPRAARGDHRLDTRIDVRYARCRARNLVGRVRASPCSAAVKRLAATTIGRLWSGDRGGPLCREVPERAREC